MTTIDYQRFLELTPKVSNQAIAKAMRRTAELLAAIEKEAGVEYALGPIVCNEAARRLELTSNSTEVMKQVEDLSRRVYEVITPENVALGHTWLKRKLVEVISAN